MIALGPPSAHPSKRLWRAGVAVSTVLAVAFTATAARAQSTPPPSQPGAKTWVWTTLPAMGDKAKIEAFAYARRSTADKREEDDDSWRTVCTAPCGIWIASGTRLRVNGDFLVGAPFTLPAAPSVRLDVKPGKIAPGITLMSAGAGVMFLTALVYGLAGETTPYENDDYTRPRALTAAEQERRDDQRNAFLGVGLVSLVGVGTGLALLLLNRKTVVHLDTAEASTGVARGFSLSSSGIHF